MHMLLVPAWYTSAKHSFPTLFVFHVKVLGSRFEVLDHGFVSLVETGAALLAAILMFWLRLRYT
jgi:hypothetical protein